MYLDTRKLAGFASADYMRTSLVIEALDHLDTVCTGLNGTVFRSDHGGVTTSLAFSERCQELGVTQSIGDVGTSA